MEALEGCIGEDGVQKLIIGMLKQLEVKNECWSCIAFKQLNDANVS